MGSRAKGTHKPDSDWDFVFPLDKEAEFYECVSILEKVFTCTFLKDKITFITPGCHIDLMLGLNTKL